MDIGLLVLRVVVGLTLAAHGSQKLFGWFGGGGLDGTAGHLEQLGFRPGKLYAAVTGLAEAGGGASLALGLLTPLGAAAVIGAMVAAVVSAHWSKGFFATKGGYEYALALAAAGVALAFTGPGRFSLDRALGWTLAGNEWGLGATALGIVTAAGVLLARRRAPAESAEPGPGATPQPS